MSTVVHKSIFIKTTWKLTMCVIYIVSHGIVLYRIECRPLSEYGRWMSHLESTKLQNPCVWAWISRVLLMVPDNYSVNGTLNREVKGVFHRMHASPTAISRSQSKGAWRPKCGTTWQGFHMGPSDVFLANVNDS